MATLADAFIRIRPDMDGFPTELKTKAEIGAGGSGQQVGKKFGAGFMAGVGSLVAAGAVIGFFKGAFNEAQESVKVQRLTDAAIRSTGGAAKVTSVQMAELAGKLSDMAGIDDELIQSSENVLLTFTRVRNEVGAGNDIFNQGTEAALNLSVALGTDLQSATILVGKALNDPVSGLTALKKAGIQFTDTQRETIRTMVQTGDTMGAQKAILAELTTQFGGAAEAAATPADKARVAWGNFQEMVGNKLLPMLNDILQFGLANQAWLVPLSSAIAGLAVVIGTVVAVQKTWAVVQAALGSSLDGTARKASRAAVAISIFAAAAALIEAALPRAQTDVQGLADSLGHLGETGKASGEAVRLWGDDLAGIQHDASLMTSWMAGIGRSAETIPFVTQAFEELGISTAGATERFGQIDDALAQMVRSGNVDGARAAYFRLMQAANLSADEMEKLAPKYVNATMQAERAVGKLADAEGRAAGEGESLLDVWDRLHGEMLSADEAMVAAKKAVDDVADAFKQGGKSIRGNSDAALDNRISLEKAARAAADAAQKYFDAGGSVKGAEKIMRDFEAATLAAAGASGKDAKALKALADSLFAIPQNITSNVDVTVKVKTSTAQDFSSQRNNERKWGNFIGPVLNRQYASGGIEDHVAQIVRAGAMRLWGEPETGGEAYIPLGGQKRAQSMNILSTVAKRFGYGLTPSGGDVMTIGAGTGGSDDYGALLAEMRRTNQLLAGLRLVANADGLALAVRAGEKQLRYAG